MTDWPPLTEPKLLARLALGDDGFAEFAKNLYSLVPPRPFTELAIERALTYPWARPSSSFYLVEDRAIALAEMHEDERENLLEGAAIEEAGGLRFPLLAIGSNGAPEALAAKFAGLDPADRELLVVDGSLRDFDIGASAHVATYGSMPATLFPSFGTRVRASLLWVTTAQLTALAWTEVNYFFGRLDGIEFLPDDDLPLSSAYVFVSRLGAHTVKGQPVALAAIDADERASKELSQKELLDGAAARVLGEAAGASELIELVHQDFAAAAGQLVPELATTALPFESERWTRFPGFSPG
jgi:hypothetical protein